MSSNPIRTAVLGFGYWGPHMARNISQIPGFDLCAIIDSSSIRRSVAEKLYPSASMFTSLEDALQNVELDALVIATPTHTHFDLGMQAIEFGLHAIIEKPLTTSVTQARTMVQRAAQKSLVFMVDHTYVYSPAVSRLKEYVDTGYLGELVYFDSTRVNLGLFQPDISVLWDLAVHDLAILHHITGRHPSGVSASGGRHINAKHEAAAFLTLYFDDLFFAHINVSWLSPLKIRRTVLSGKQHTILFDDMIPDEKIRIYEVGVDQDENSLLHYRLGGVEIPKIVNSEALRNELEHFRDCIQSGLTPQTSAETSLGIIATLESAQQSMDDHGSMITVPTLDALLL